MYRDFTMDKKEYRLFISQIIRILLTIFILLIKDIPLFAKIILIMLFDSIDCGISKYLYEDWISCDTEIYQKSDKIIDIICYLLLAISISYEKAYMKKYVYIIFGLFFYRFIGTILYIITNIREYLFYFPNFFLEYTLLTSLAIYFPKVCKYMWLIIPFMIVIKLLQEYYLHIYKVSTYNCSLKPVNTF